MLVSAASETSRRSRPAPRWTARA